MAGHVVAASSREMRRRQLTGGLSLLAAEDRKDGRGAQAL
jgi:hypothetical protein